MSAIAHRMTAERRRLYLRHDDPALQDAIERLVTLINHRADAPLETIARIDARIWRYDVPNGAKPPHWSGSIELVESET
jgi:hypothetical protein